VICANCGTQNLAGAKFCNECASPLAAGCPNCGFANPSGAKFCAECATPLTAGVTPITARATASASTATRTASTASGATPPAPGAEAVAERRLVSILFADLVGFTPFAEERDAEEVRETLTRYFEMAQEIIGRYGGTIEKFIGDAVMAVWGAPVAQEDDAERAVRAALDLVDRVAGLSPGIQARAGILTGEAAITIGATNQGMVAGDLVNTASRLQSVAEPGTVLVGEATQRATSEAIVFEQVGDKELKGKMSPVPAWRAMRVVAQVGGRGRTETLEAPFVGRHEEMRLLKDLFHATSREGRPRLVSIIGPGGIGKSRLAWEFEKYIDGLSELVWWHDGRSPAYGEGITFWALGEMVRERAELLESDDEATTREKIAVSVAQHVPNEDERPAIERALLVLLGFGSGGESQSLFAAWRIFFERLADTNPVAMVFEDLHFADQGLLDFIDHMLEWSRNSPITIITLARPELLEKRPNWGAGQRSFTSIYLESLSDAEMRELLAGLVPGLPPKAISSIVGRADGIPLYAVETVRMLLAQGRLTLEDGVYRPTGHLEDIAVPETLTALIAARLDSLDPADRSLIADASVLGQSFTLSALAALSGGAPGMLEAQLAGLVRRELLRREVDPRSPERGQYAFVQALIREVAHNTLSKKDRKTRHLAAARYFEGLGTEEVAGALAGHCLAAYRAAGEGAEADALKVQARLALRGAAERAAALGSHEQAIALLEQALEITTTLTDRADLERRAFYSAAEGTSAPVARRHGEAAVAAFRELGDRPATVAQIAHLARVIRNLAGDPKGSLEMSLAAWDEFSDLEQTRAGLQLILEIGGGYATLGMADDLMWRERAVSIAERLDVPEELSMALNGLGGTWINRGRPRAGLMILRGSHAAALEHGYSWAERQARNLLSFYEQWNDPANGLRLVRDAFEIARQIGSTQYAFLMVGNGILCALRVGEWEWAADVLDDWLGRDLDNDQTAEFMLDRAVLRGLRGEDAAGDLERAKELVSDSTDPQFSAYIAWTQAWLALSSGQTSEAIAKARVAAETILTFPPLARPLAARAALWSRDAASARAEMDRLHDTTSWGRALTLDEATIAAGIAALEGRTAEALAGYREVFAGWRALNLAWDEALAVIDAVMLVGADTAEVRTAADWARATLTRLGAKPYLERLEAALAGGPQRPSASAGELSSARVEETAAAG
jgi:class 3 adenylate cyclase